MSAPGFRMILILLFSIGGYGFTSAQGGDSVKGIPTQREGEAKIPKGEDAQIVKLKEEAQSLEEKGDERKKYATRSAIKFYLNALSIQQGVGDTESVLRLTEKLASAYSFLDEYDNALKYQYAVLMHYRHLDDSLKLAQCYSSLSDLYANKNDMENALANGQLALKIATLTHSKRGIAALRNNLAGIYHQMDSLDKAFEWVGEAVKINQEMGNKQWLGINYTLYADLYGDLGKRDSVGHYLAKAFALVQDCGDASDSIAIFRKLGIHFHHSGKPKLALEYFNKGITVSQRIGSLKSESNFNHWISEVYQNSGQMDMALAYLNNYYDLKDSLARQQNKEEVEAMRVLFEVTELEDSLAISHANEQLAQEELSNKKLQLYTVSAAFLLLVLLGTVIVWQMRRQARSNAHLLKMNMESLEKPLEKSNSEKYATSSLSDDKRDEILAGLKALMEGQQIFKDPQLKLETVADQLGVSRTYLSQIINQAIGENFSSYINALRIRLAKEYLTRDDFQKYSIQGIAEMVGFNSLSTFNASFKKETGLTPSYFRKNARPPAP